MKIKILKNTLYTLAVVALLGVAAMIVANHFQVGGVRVLAVQSGSMEPSIGKHSIVVTAPSSLYQTHDVITFKQSGRDDVLVTHRVVNVRKTPLTTEYTTKGDANEEADSESVPARDVVGKVVISVPFVGAVVSFAQTTPGFIILIVVPAVIIVYSELLSIKKQIQLFIYKKKSKKLFHSFKNS